MTYKCLLFELKDGVATLTLNRPERLNALGDTLRDDLHDAILKCSDNPEVRVIVITGAGKGFCSGGDVKAMNEAKEGRRERPLNEKIAPNRDLTLLAMRDAPQPIIAAINGAAAGAGFNLALGCDIRIASTAASFVCSGVNVGLMASAYRLPRLIGVARAKHMLLTGLPHNAQIAREFGLVTAIHEPDQLMPEAIKLAERIASRAPLSVEAVKRSASLAPDLTPEEFAQVNNKEISVLSHSADHHEALAAFAEKREPKFRRE